MTIWLDHHLSPQLARWFAAAFSLNAVPIRSLGLHSAQDTQIFFAAKSASVVVMTKDENLVHLVRRFGSPPQIIWVTCGNTFNASLFALLTKKLPPVLDLIRSGEPIVEIR